MSSASVGASARVSASADWAVFVHKTDASEAPRRKHSIRPGGYTAGYTAALHVPLEHAT